MGHVRNDMIFESCSLACCEHQKSSQADQFNSWAPFPKLPNPAQQKLPCCLPIGSDSITKTGKYIITGIQFEMYLEYPGIVSILPLCSLVVKILAEPPVTLFRSLSLENQTSLCESVQRLELPPSKKLHLPFRLLRNRSPFNFLPTPRSKCGDPWLPGPAHELRDWNRDVPSRESHARFPSQQW